MSNMKQLGLALTQYSQDYNNLLPSPAISDGNGWREAVYPYVKSTNVYRCPDDERSGSKDTPNHLPNSYAANVHCLSTGRKKTTVFSLAPTAIIVTDTRGFGGED